VIVGGESYLVDCGPGIVRRAAAAAQRHGLAALEPPKLQRVFITHLHSDHTVGLPDLIFTPWVLERNEPLQVFGPPGVAAMVEHVLKAYEEDVHIRLDGLQPQANPGLAIAHEIAPGTVYRDAHVTVKAFEVTHGSWRHAFGFRFESADRTIVISGDTTPCQNLIDHARGCDVLVHEVYSEVGFLKRPPQWQRYHAASHTSSRQLGAIASQVRPRLLVLYHELFWGSSEEELVNEVRRFYDGPVVAGRDLDLY
jgi:ribonuclease BN (tRNA processing enzyme)